MTAACCLDPIPRKLPSARRSSHRAIDVHGGLRSPADGRDTCSRRDCQSSTRAASENGRTMHSGRSGGSFRTAHTDVSSAAAGPAPLSAAPVPQRRPRSTGDRLTSATLHNKAQGVPTAGMIRAGRECDGHGQTKCECGSRS
eukprot:7385613-Prymnesium_polylepis.1